MNAISMLDKIRLLWEHAVWADRHLLDALQNARDAPMEAVREFAHVVGVEEVWLARIKGRSSRAAVWPSVTIAEIERLVAQTHAAYESFFAGLQTADLETEIAYKNSAGLSFTNTVEDILLHVAMHGQYHRGKVNLMLRQSSNEPMPVDYIAYVRGAPAATTAHQSAAKQ